jgi:sugar/nucleoside kinase (ribokinase family)
LANDCALLFDRLKSDGIVFSDKVFVITTGIDGCYVVQSEKQRPVLRHFPPAKPIKDGDATGCGDCFSAGMVAALGQGLSSAKAAEWGNKAGFERVAGKAAYFILADKRV